MALLRSVVVASSALCFACGSNGVTAGAGDSSAGDARDGSVDDASRDGSGDAIVDARDGDAGCAPRFVLGADPAQITVLGDAPLWKAASPGETLVGYAWDDTTVVLADELPGNPARWAMVVAPFDRSAPRQIAVETSGPLELRVFDRAAYWLSSGATGAALRTIAIDAVAPTTPHTVTTFPSFAVQGAYFVDGDSVYWLERRKSADANAGDDAVLVHTKLAGDGAPQDGPTLGAYPPSTSPSSYFQSLSVKNGYVYVAHIALSGDPPVASDFAIQREPVAGGSVESIAQNHGGIAQIFTTERFVYWVVDRSTHDGSGSVVTVDYAIAQAALDGSGARVVALHDPINGIGSVPYVHAMGGVLYWFDGPNATAEFVRAFCE